MILFSSLDLKMRKIDTSGSYVTCPRHKMVKSQTQDYECKIAFLVLKLHCLSFMSLILLPCVCTDYFSKHVLCISHLDISQLFLKTPDGKAMQ